MTGQRLITPENLNRVGNANKELNALIDMFKDDSITFDHIDNSYLPLLKKYYPEVVSKIIDIRRIEDNEIDGITDVEMNCGIFTFSRHSEEEGIPCSTYRVCNDICLCEDAEIETESGYMENMHVHTLLHGGYHLTWGE